MSSRPDTSDTGRPAPDGPGVDTADPLVAGTEPTADEADLRGRDMGASLRSIYQRTVDEDVPDEMMDLLGKLG